MCDSGCPQFKEDGPDAVCQLAGKVVEPFSDFTPIAVCEPAVERMAQQLLNEMPIPSLADMQKRIEG